MLDPFEQRRAQVLQGLSSQERDKSVAGGVDARIQSLVDCMNQHPDLYTTSSCSGRISVFAEPSAETRAAGKKGGEWVYATHDLADGQQVNTCIQQRMVTGSKLIFRFEPFILAAECRDMSSAQKLVGVARQAGFRESGVTATKARTIAGIRCSLRLEVPVAHEGRMLVDQSYLQRYLVDFGNEKMEANWNRTARLHQLFEDQMLSYQTSIPVHTAQQPSSKKKSKAFKQQSRAAEQGHLSAFAMQQLSQSGVSPQLLQQIQAGSDSTPHQPLQPQSQAKLWSKTKDQTCSSRRRKLGLADRAEAVDARQKAILQRISCLEGDQAHSSQEDASSTSSKAELAWQYVKPVLQGVESSTLNRWGHSTTMHGDTLVVFGGYGGPGAHSRTADLLVYDCASNVLQSPVTEGLSPPACMGHSAVLLCSTLIIFGGRISPAQPLNAVWALDLDTLTWRSVACKGPVPAARFRHTAAAVGSQLKDGKMVVHGGYDGNDTFSDTWVLRTADWSWQQLPTSGGAPAPCHSHAAAVVQNQMIVFGGTSGYQETFSGLHALDLTTGHWETITLVAPTEHPPSCFSHSLTAVGGLLVLAGGCRTTGADHVHVFDPSLKQWSKHAVSNSSRLVLCRHTATALQDKRSIIFLGGGMNCFGFGTTFSPAVLLDLSSLINQDTALQAATAKAYATAGSHATGSSMHHNQDGDRGPPAEASFPIEVDPLMNAESLPASESSQGSCPASKHPLQTRALSHVSAAAVSSASVHDSPAAGDETSSQKRACNGHVSSQMQGKQGLAVARLQAKAAKDALKSLGWLDQSCRAQADAQNHQICLPLTDEGSTMLQSLHLSSCNGNLDQSADDTLSVATPGAAALQADAQLGMANDYVSGSQPVATQQDCPTKGSQCSLKGKAAESKGKAAAGKGREEGDLACLVELMQGGLAEVKPLQVQRVARHEGGPAQRLKTAVTSILQHQALPQERIHELLLELPSRWEKLGDLALLPRNFMTSHEWGALQQPPWKAIADALGVKRLAAQAPVANTGTRDSQARLLLGVQGWVQHKEGGVLYCLDVTKCMFSSGNTTERQRMGRLQCAGETVVDLYAGIGYYTLPFLCKAGAAQVVACEWNPNAIQALHKNLQLNGVADRCQVLEGDSGLTAPKGVADRVSLGLLPSSQGGWGMALAALKPELGGWLHLHHNVTDTEEAEWCQQTLATLQQLADQMGRSWHCRLEHCERVKWYAPHVRHLVLDIHVQAIPSG